jgi:hypothetical protein
VRAGELGNPEAGPGRRRREDDLLEHLAGGEGRLEPSRKEVPRRDVARPGGACDAHGCVERERGGGKLGCGIRMGDAAADGAAMPDRRMRHVVQSLREERHLRGDIRVVLDVPLARARAHVDLAVPTHVRELANRPHIDEMRRLRQPEVHQGDQALAAGKDACLVTELIEHREELVSRRRRVVVEHRRLQFRLLRHSRPRLLLGLEPGDDNRLRNPDRLCVGLRRRTLVSFIAASSPWISENHSDHGEAWQGDRQLRRHGIDPHPVADASPPDHARRDCGQRCGGGRGRRCDRASARSRPQDRAADA